MKVKDKNGEWQTFYYMNLLTTPWIVIPDYFVAIDFEDEKFERTVSMSKDIEILGSTENCIITLI